MCGIVGICSLGGGSPVTVEALERMCGTLAHRGPDGQRVEVLPGLGLGHTRLSVIDLETGWQPIWNEDRTVVVIQNGEIYNYRELRAELRERGHVFSTDSDTEVIVHLYEELGVDCLECLRGMFAIALWDTRRKRLLLARDRLGKKPLYYARQDGALLFASETHGILANPRYTPEIDAAALHGYFTYGYIHPPRTVLRGVSKLPPAHLMVVQDGDVEIRRYWGVERTNVRGVRSREWREQLRQTLQEAVTLRLRADVPLGCFLSGGLDSSIVAALAARSLDRPLKTFSVGFEEGAYNELGYARLVAERYGTDHTEIVVRPNVAEELPAIVETCDEPVNDSSMVPLYVMARLARRDVTVAIGGDGGDEVFAGYHRYRTDGWVALYQSLPRLLTDGVITPIIEALPPGPGRLSIVRRLQRIVGSPRTSPEERYARWLRAFGSVLPSDGDRTDAYTPFMRDRLAADPVEDPVVAAVAEAPGSDRLSRVQWADQVTYLPGDLLVKADRMTMAHGLELRSPLLDQEVVELAAAVPSRFMVRGTTGKHLLRSTFSDLVPSEILDRRKQGFNVPIAEWLRTDLRALATDVLADPNATVHAFLRPEYTGGLLDEHLAGEDHSSKLWALLFLELWFRAHGLEAPVSRPRSGTTGAR